MVACRAAAHGDHGEAVEVADSGARAWRTSTVPSPAGWGVRGHRRRRSSCAAVPGKVGWKFPGLSRARATRAYAHIALRPARRGFPARKFPCWKLGRHDSTGTAGLVPPGGSEGRRARRLLPRSVTVLGRAGSRLESGHRLAAAPLVGTGSVGAVAAAAAAAAGGQPVAAARPSGCAVAAPATGTAGSWSCSGRAPGPGPGRSPAHGSAGARRDGLGAAARRRGRSFPGGNFPGGGCSRPVSTRCARRRASRAHARHPGISFARCGLAATRRWRPRSGCRVRWVSVR